ncbi:MAG: hypothetical protein GY851_36440, partial [bacterium]|nr:hypothetical protein [bacterium]
MNPLTQTTQASFAVVDWAVVALYLIAMVAIGLWMARGQKSKRDYFLGGRNLNWFVVGVSIVATETSALTFIGVPAMALGALKLGPDGFFTTGGNLFWMDIVVGYIIARIIV